MLTSRPGHSASELHRPDNSMSKATLLPSRATRLATTPDSEPDPSGAVTCSPINSSNSEEISAQAISAKHKKSIPENDIVVVKRTTTFPPSNAVGAIEGSDDGSELGSSEGIEDGFEDGWDEGSKDGSELGKLEGIEDGSEEGNEEGSELGTSEGKDDGADEG